MNELLARALSKVQIDAIAEHAETGTRLDCLTTSAP
jgi:hypothetical protein